VAISAAVICLLRESAGAGLWGRIVEILLLSTAFDMVTARIDALRRQMSSGPFVDMSSVWSFAAAIILPPGYASLVVAVLGLRQWFAQQRKHGGKLYRSVATWVAIMLAVQCASATLGDLRSPLASLPIGVGLSISVVVALILYFVIDTVVLLGLRYLAVRPAPAKVLLGSAEDAWLMLAGQCLGGLAAVTLLHQPWLIVLVLPPMFILQRGALVNQLQQAATTDAKTGLLNATTWEQLAHREISRAEREGNRLALLILDLDFFKDVNDRHGHLAGDAALVDVARCLTKELRSYDIIGRFGGEEFVAMLPDIELAEARRAAERIRARIALLPIAPSSNQSYAASQPPVSDATLSASIGVAGYPFHGLDLPTLLHRADAALYAAKQAGRNRVVIADHGLGRRSDGSRLPTR
jgi:diguanylate cyclase (GGDEF)-like protein